MLKITKLGVVSGLAAIFFFFLCNPLLAQGDTIRISVTSLGDEGNGNGYHAAASSQCWYVAFESAADDLVPGDNNLRNDIFVHDRTMGYTTRVSVSSTGQEGNRDHLYPSISADGRFVAFESESYNLVPSDNNWQSDIFVRDRYLKQTERASVNSTGKEANGGCYRPSISADGRYVAFESWASNLVPGDESQTYQIYVHDRLTGTTVRASQDSSGVKGNGYSRAPSISPDGRYVAFQSDADNLVPDDNNLSIDVFLHDLSTGQTTRVSVDSAGVEGNGDSYWASVSNDGLCVAFQSLAYNLVPGDTNSAVDVFVHERLSGQTERVSVSSSGVQGNGYSEAPSISFYGQYVSFWSNAWNLVPGDNNFKSDIFVHDRSTGETARVSVDSEGIEGDNASDKYSAISPEGGHIAFGSWAANLVPGDFNNKCDVFIHSKYPLKALKADTHTLPETGGAVLFSLNAGNGNAFRSYLILGSVTGTEPGTPLPGGMATLPLNWDVFTGFVFSLVNTPVFTGFLGTLDLSGAGGAQFNAPAMPGSAGVVMYFAYALNNPWNFASNPVGVEIVP